MAGKKPRVHALCGWRRDRGQAASQEAGHKPPLHALSGGGPQPSPPLPAHLVWPACAERARRHHRQRPAQRIGINICAAKGVAAAAPRRRQLPLRKGQQPAAAPLHLLGDGRVLEGGQRVAAEEHGQPRHAQQQVADVRGKGRGGALQPVRHHLQQGRGGRPGQRRGGCEGERRRVRWRRLYWGGARHGIAWRTARARYARQAGRQQCSAQAVASMHVCAEGGWAVAPRCSWVRRERQPAQQYLPAAPAWPPTALRAPARSAPAGGGRCCRRTSGGSAGAG